MLAPALVILLALAAPQLGDAAPPFDLPGLAVGRVDSAQLRGRVTVVEIFATWCAPCGRSLEDLRAIRTALGPAVQVLVLAVESEPAALRAYFRDHPLPEGAVVARDDSGDTARRWGKDRLPTTFFVDRAGIIRHINRGHGPGFRARATRWLSAMLAAPG